MDENEFEFIGKAYIAVVNDTMKCDGCALVGETETGYCLDEHSEHPCVAGERKDRRNVIYIEKQQ